MSMRAEKMLAAYHQSSPLRAGMPREELRSRLGMEVQPFDPFIASLVADGRVADAGAALALDGHRPELTRNQQDQVRAYLALMETAPFAPPTEATLPDDMLVYLEDSGQVVRASDGVVFLASAYDEMQRRVTNHIRQTGSITLAEARDMFGTSRKYAQALLEHLDALKITRRVDDARVLR
jgi:selenocysteine-specific elongation factor